MGCFGALFKSSSSSSKAEYAPAYAQPAAAAKAAPELKVVQPSIPKDVAHFEPCGCGDLSHSFSKLMTEDVDLPAYEEFSEFKGDNVSAASHLPSRGRSSQASRVIPLRGRSSS